MKWIPLLLVVATLGFVTSSAPADAPLTLSTFPIVKIQLPFLPHGLKTSPDDRFAICWGASMDPMTGALPGNGPGAANRYAIIDIRKGTVVHQQSLSQDIGAMHIDDEYVYLAPQGASIVSRSRHDSTEVVDKILLDGPAQDLVFLPAGKLALLCGGLSRGKICVYDTKPLERVRHPLSEREPGSLETQRRDLSSRVRPLTGGLFYEDGVLWDTESNTIQCIVMPPHLAEASIGSSRPTQDAGRFLLPQWGRVFESHGLHDARGARIDRPDPFTVSQLLRQAPLIVGVGRKQETGNRAAELELTLREVLTGQRLESLSLGKPQPRTLAGLHSSQLAFFAETADRVLVGYPGGLAMFSIPAALMARTRVPLHLKPPKIAVGRVNDKLQFDIDAAGGAANKRFSLLNESAGLAIDGRSGQVTIDGREIWKRLPQSNPGALSLMDEWNADQRGRRIAEFAHVTGQELGPDQVSLSVRVAVAVSDQEKGFDQLTLYAILVATREELAEIAPKPAAGNPPNVAGGTAPAPARPEVGTEPEERIRNLEGRLRRTEAALQEAIQQLEALERRSTPPR